MVSTTRLIDKTVPHWTRNIEEEHYAVKVAIGGQKQQLVLACNTLSFKTML